MTASCAGCGAQWTGTKTEHCSAKGCHLTFTSTSAGDMHRIGPPTERRCLTIEAMVRKGMRANLNGQGVSVWGTGRENPRFPADGHGSAGLPAVSGPRVPDMGSEALESAVCGHDDCPGALRDCAGAA